jgi:hypothetical protein
MVSAPSRKRHANEGLNRGCFNSSFLRATIYNLSKRSSSRNRRPDLLSKAIVSSSLIYYTIFPPVLQGDAILRTGELVSSSVGHQKLNFEFLVRALQSRVIFEKLLKYAGLLHRSEKSERERISYTEI